VPRPPIEVTVPNAPPAPHVPPVPPPTPTTLTLSCPASVFLTGSSTGVTVTGTLSPNVPGSLVSITFQRPTMGPFTDSVSTDLAGTYSNTFSASEDGNWSATAHFAGDTHTNRAPTDSLTCNFTVMTALGRDPLLAAARGGK
jgi:hypothetical protein